MYCATCKHRIPSKNINVSDDIVHCPSCGARFKPSEGHTTNLAHEAVDFENPPDGISIKEKEDQVSISVSSSSPVALILTPFMLIWTGLSVKVLVSIDWSHFNFEISIIVVLLGFSLATFVFWILTLIKIIGRVEISANNNQAQVFAGMFGIGLKATFEISTINLVEEKSAGFELKGENGKTLVLRGKKDISLRFGITKQRREFLKRYIEEKIIKR